MFRARQFDCYGPGFNPRSRNQRSHQLKKKKKDNYSDLVQRFSTGGSFVLPAPREHLAMSEETSSCDLWLRGERVPLGSSGKMPEMLLSSLQCLGQPPAQGMILTCGAEAEKLEGLEATGKTWSEHACSVAQSCPTLCDPMDFSPPGSSVHRIILARILEWVAISFSGVWTHTHPLLGFSFQGFIKEGRGWGLTSKQTRLEREGLCGAHGWGWEGEVIFTVLGFPQAAKRTHCSTSVASCISYLVLDPIMHLVFIIV